MPSEAVDALEREKATSRCRPLHQSWQNFVYQLRLKKPKLGTCLDKTLTGNWLAEQSEAVMEELEAVREWVNELD